MSSVRVTQRVPVAFQCASGACLEYIRVGLKRLKGLNTLCAKICCEKQLIHQGLMDAPTEEKYDALTALWNGAEKVWRCDAVHVLQRRPSVADVTRRRRASLKPLSSRHGGRSFDLDGRTKRSHNRAFLRDILRWICGIRTTR